MEYSQHEKGKEGKESGNGKVDTYGRKTDTEGRE